MIAVIGCGNANRCDDGVGPEILRMLFTRGLARDSENIKLLDAGTDGMAVMFAARGCKSLIVVDACRSGSAPGAIFEIPGHEVERRPPPALNAHEFRWDHALFAGRNIFREAFPEDVTVILIEAETVGYGIGLSPRVAAAANRVADRVGVLASAHARESQSAQ